jgi:hypothetical protein
LGTPGGVDRELTGCAHASVQDKKQAHKALKNRWFMPILQKKSAQQHDHFIVGRAS